MKTAYDLMAKAYECIRGKKIPRKTDDFIKKYDYIKKEFIDKNSFDLHKFKSNQYDKYLDDTIFCYALIKAIDEYVPYSFYPNQPFGRIARFEYVATPLNSNIEIVKIFPNTSDSIINEIEKKGLTEKSNSVKINEHLKSYVFVEREYDFSVKLIKYVDDRLTRKVKGEGKFSISYIPLFKTDLIDHFAFIPDEKTLKFTVKEYVDKTHILEKKYFASLDFALLDNEVSNIIIFPEICITKEIADITSKHISDLNLEKPCLIITGSYWKDRKNTLYVYNQSGDKILEHSKMTPYIHNFGKEFNDIECEEDLSLDEKSVTILDVEGIGRFTFNICKDYFDVNYKNFLGDFDVDITLISSLSMSRQVFRDASYVSNNFHCISTYLNSCYFIKDKMAKEVGAITYPFKSSSKQQYIEFEISTEDRLGCINCKNICKGIKLDFDYKNGTCTCNSK